MPSLNKCTFNNVGQDYVYLYEALRVMPEEHQYNLMEGDSDCLVVWVWLNEPRFKFVKRLLDKAEEIKFKEIRQPLGSNLYFQWCI